MFFGEYVLWDKLLDKTFKTRSGYIMTFSSMEEAYDFASTHTESYLKDSLTENIIAIPINEQAEYSDN